MALGMSTSSRAPLANRAGRGRSRWPARPSSIGPEVDGVAVPDVLPTGDGVGHVVEDDPVDGRSGHGHRLLRSAAAAVETRRPSRGSPDPACGRSGRPPVRSRSWTFGANRWSDWPSRCATGELTALRAGGSRPGPDRRHNRSVNAFVAVDEERARTAAERCRRRRWRPASTPVRWPASRSG